MDKGTKANHFGLTTVLLVTSLLANAIHTAALRSNNFSTPADDFTAPDDAPTLEDSDIDTTRYKEANSDDIGTYDVEWTDSTPNERKSDTCQRKGYYDDTVLRNETAIRSCFAELATMIKIGVEAGVEFLTDTYYYPSDSNPYCAIICIEGSASCAVSLMQMSFVSLAFALLAFPAVNYL